MKITASDLVRKNIYSQKEDIKSIFDRLKECSTAEIGITRDTYGEGESRAHGLLGEMARSFGLEVSTDAAANTYMTLPGVDRGAPRVIIGSHLDSVPNGGNFDGAAGVVAGLVCLKALSDAGFRPECDISVMGIRAEESVWFQISYIGSRAALGNLPPNALAAPRIDTGEPLAAHIAASGGDPDALERGVAALKPQEVRAFLELHIEQAPSLVELGKSIGIGIAIPGNFRFPDVRITGVYGHVGTPRRFRRDAVLAATEFAHRLDAIWKRLEEEGTPMAMTLGRFHTNIEAHGLTTVPGELFLSIDIRAYDPDVLASLEAALYEIVEEIQVRHGVSIHLGQRASAPIARCAAGIVESFTRGAETLGLSAMHLLSPASHDAAAFAQAGVPIGMIFVRNENGSHNPQEQMDIDDFLDGVALLGWWLTENLAGDRANLPRFDEAPTG